MYTPRRFCFALLCGLLISAMTGIAYAQPGALAIQGPDQIEAPSFSEAARVFSYSLAGEAAPSSGVRWGVTDAPGVSLDEKGTLTLSSGVSHESLTIVAEWDGMEAPLSKTVTVSESQMVTALLVDGPDTLRLSPLQAGTACFAVLALDQDQRAIPSAPVSWRVKGPKGVSITRDGVVTVPAGLTEGSVVVTVSCGELSDQKTLTLAKDEAAAHAVVLSGPSYLIAPAQEGESVSGALEATVLDQYGNVLPGANVQWSIEPLAGCSIGQDGVLMVEKGAAEGFVTVVAKAGGQSGRWQTQIIGETPVAVDCEPLAGDQNVVIPGEGAATAAYTATMVDQYGQVVLGGVRWSVSGPSGVSMDASTGVLTVESTVSPTTVTVTASSGMTSASKNVALTSLPLIKSFSIEGSHHAVSGQEAQYTAVLVDLNGRAMQSAAVEWTLSGGEESARVTGHGLSCTVVPAQEGAYTLTAAYSNSSATFDIVASEAAPALSGIRLAGPAAIMAPDSGEVSFPYSATGSDQYGDDQDISAATWTLEGKDGVSLNGQGGSASLTVQSGAAPATVTLTATVGDVTGSIKVDILPPEAPAKQEPAADPASTEPTLEPEADAPATTEAKSDQEPAATPVQEPPAEPQEEPKQPEKAVPAEKTTKEPEHIPAALNEIEIESAETPLGVSLPWYRQVLNWFGRLFGG